PSRSSSNVDCCIAAADHCYSSANLHVVEAIGFCLLNERESICAAADVFRFNLQVFGFSEPNTEEKCVVLTLQLCQRYIASDRDSVLDLYSKCADHFSLMYRVC